MEDIDWSCPADLEPYAKAHNLALQEQDSMVYAFCGGYVLSAVAVAVERCLAGRKANLKYIEKPILQELEEKNRPMTEDEKQKAVDLFFSKENARRVNWNREKERRKKHLDMGGKE